MNKLLALFVLLSVCASLSSGLPLRRASVGAAAAANTTLSANTLQGFSVVCTAGACPVPTFVVQLPAVVFRPSTRNVGLRMRFANATCALLSTGAAVPCPNFTKTDGMRMIMRNGKSNAVVPGSNFTAWIPGKLSREQIASGVDQEQPYIISVYAPVTADADVVVTSFAGQVEAIYDTNVPVWVIIVLALGGLLVVFLLIAVAWCLYKRCSSKKNDYERFD